MGGLTNGQISGLVGFALMIALGQVLFKQAALVAAQHTHGTSSMMWLFRAPTFWVAIAIYGSSTLLWTYMLQTVPLSRAYPFVSLGFVIVPLVSVFVFGEKITAPYVVGSAMILTGILVTIRS